MKNKSNLVLDARVSTAVKKTWLKPEVEIIDQDIIESGQAGFLSEAGNLGILPAVDYNS